MKTFKGLILTAAFAAVPFARAEFINGFVDAGTGGASGVSLQWNFCINTDVRHAQLSGLTITPNAFDPDTGEPMIAEGTYLYLTIPESIELQAGSNYPGLDGFTGPFPVVEIASGAFSDLNMICQGVHFGHRFRSVAGSARHHQTRGFPVHRRVAGHSPLAL